MKILLVAAGLTLLLTAPAVAVEKLNAVVIHNQSHPSALNFSKNFIKIARKTCAASSLSINLVGGSEIVSPRTAGDAVAKGVFDILYGPATWSADKIPEAYSLTGSDFGIQKLRTNGGWELLQKIFETKGNVKLLAWGESNNQMGIYLREPPKFDRDSIPTLKGQKIRTTSFGRGFVERLNGTSPSVSLSEAYTALERGVIDGTMVPVTSFTSLGLHKVLKYKVATNYYRSSNVVTVNLKKWSSLSKKQQSCLTQASLAFEKMSMDYTLKLAAEEKKAMDSNGVKIVHVSQRAQNVLADGANDEIWKLIERRSPEFSGKLATSFRCSGDWRKAVPPSPNQSPRLSDLIK